MPVKAGGGLTPGQDSAPSCLAAVQRPVASGCWFTLTSLSCTLPETQNLGIDVKQAKLAKNEIEIKQERKNLKSGPKVLKTNTQQGHFLTNLVFLHYGEWTWRKQSKSCLVMERWLQKPSKR